MEYDSSQQTLHREPAQTENSFSLFNNFIRETLKVFKIVSITLPQTTHYAAPLPG